jgi:hypothetical protein
MSEFVDHIERRDGVFLMSRSGYYFGYGLEALPDVMDALLGRSVTAELGVCAIGQQLVVQEIDQIPDQPTEQLGGKSPQEIVTNVWRQYTDVPFAAYSVRPTEARSSLVTGTLYEIDAEDALRLKEWSLMLPFERLPGGGFFWPGWKSWDHNIELVDGRNVETLTIDEQQPIDRVVDGTNYDPFLLDKEVTARVIQSFIEGLDA